MIFCLDIWVNMRARKAMFSPPSLCTRYSTITEGAGRVYRKIICNNSATICDFLQCFGILGWSRSRSRRRNKIFNKHFLQSVWRMLPYDVDQLISTSISIVLLCKATMPTKKKLNISLLIIPLIKNIYL